MPVLSSCGYRFVLAALLLLADAASNLCFAAPAAASVVQSAGCIGLTVSDRDRSIDFYSRVLSFKKIAEHEIAGDSYEQLATVFGLRARTARLKLGSECITLSEYLAPRGPPAPVDGRSKDRWFQHIAIVVSDMGRVYQVLRQARAEHASSGPQRLPDWNPHAGGIRAFYFRDPDRHVLEVLQFPPG